MCCWYAFHTDRQAKKARFYKYWEVVREKAQVVEGEIHQELMEIFGRDITNIILEFYETRLCHNDDHDESEFSLLYTSQNVTQIEFVFIEILVTLSHPKTKWLISIKLIDLILNEPLDLRIFCIFFQFLNSGVMWLLKVQMKF